MLESCFTLGETGNICFWAFIIPFKQFGAEIIF